MDDLTNNAVMLHSYLDYLTPFSNPYLHARNRHYLFNNRSRSPLGPIQYQVTLPSIKYSNPTENSYINYLRAMNYITKVPIKTRHQPTIITKPDKLFYLPDTESRQKRESFRPDKYINLDPNIDPIRLSIKFTELYLQILNTSYREVKRIFNRRKELYYPMTQINPMCPYSLFTEHITTLKDSTFKNLWRYNFNPMNVMIATHHDPDPMHYLIMDYYYDPLKHLSLLNDIWNPLYCTCQDSDYIPNNGYWRTKGKLTYDVKIFPKFRFGIWISYNEDPEGKQLLREFEYEHRDDAIGRSCCENPKRKPRHFSLWEHPKYSYSKWKETYEANFQEKYPELTNVIGAKAYSRRQIRKPNTASS